jgi:hypothetical protein
VILLAVWLAACVSAHADIVIGQTSGRSGNEIPFTDDPGNAFPLEYQQIYSHQDFPGITTISSVGFAADLDFSPFAYDMTVGLGTAATLVNAPSIHFADNAGPDFTVVESGIVRNSDGVFNLVIQTTPFTYDPSKGDLLLDIMIDANPTGGIFSAYNDNYMPDMSRIFTYYGTNSVDIGYGLTTRFGVAAVPEPGLCILLCSLILTGTSLLLPPAISTITEMIRIGNRNTT